MNDFICGFCGYPRDSAACENRKHPNLPIDFEQMRKANKNVDEFHCTTCGEEYTQEDVDGGRC